MSEPGEAPAEDTVDNGVAAKDTLLPEGVLRVRLGPGANCSSAGSAIDVLFYGSVIVGALAVALAAAFPPKPPSKDDDAGHDDAGHDDAPHEAPP
jgi:hypothetical protein